MSRSTSISVRGVFTMAVALMAMMTPLVCGASVVPRGGTSLDATVEEVLAKVDFKKLAIAPVAKSSRISGDLVVPGPGMPSLESLGLTSENLLDPDFMESYFANQTGIEDTTAKRSLSGLQKRFPDGCLGLNLPGVGFGNYPGIFGCYNYLYALGTTNCGVSNRGTTMCYQQQSNGLLSYISGVAVSGSFSNSWCRHVATGA